MNGLLASLPAEIRERLMSVARKMDLPSRQPLYQAGMPAKAVYFLDRGVASIVVNMHEGGSAEVGMIGDEGMIGVQALLGSQPMMADCFMQVPGSGLRVPMKEMQTCFVENAETRSAVLSFLRIQSDITTQLSACNKLHEAEARLSRWLLMAADRAHSEHLELTQEFLSQMLGTMRTTVALVAGVIQRSGYISYSRGRLTILNREGLTALACECYTHTRQALLPIANHAENHSFSDEHDKDTEPQHRSIL